MSSAILRCTRVNERALDFPLPFNVVYAVGCSGSESVLATRSNSSRARAFSFVFSELEIPGRNRAASEASMAVASTERLEFCTCRSVSNV